MVDGRWPVPGLIVGQQSAPCLRPHRGTHVTCRTSNGDVRSLLWHRLRTPVSARAPTKRLMGRALAQVENHHKRALPRVASPLKGHLCPTNACNTPIRHAGGAWPARQLSCAGGSAPKRPAARPVRLFAARASGAATRAAHPARVLRRAVHPGRRTKGRGRPLLGSCGPLRP